MVPAAEMIILRIGIWDDAGLMCGAHRVDNVVRVVLFYIRTMVQV